MNYAELAKKLAQIEYPCDVPEELIAEAKAHGLVIVFGASDDLMEFRGAIDDELGAYEGTTAYLDGSGLIQNECEEEECPYFARLLKNAVTLEAVWGEEGYSWTFKTRIPHATFDVMEEGETYCRGIVFARADVPTTPRD